MARPPLPPPALNDAPLEPGLYLVATPIGNLRDITLRALDVLAGCDLILAEDTRVTGKLMSAYGLKKKLERCDDHAAARIAPKILELLAEGGRIALVSDAGTPLINDPGYRIVTAAAERGIQVIPIPGPVAFVAALTASGLSTDELFFGGFLPARRTARRAKLEQLRSVRATLIFYEAPHRIAASLKDCAEVMGDRHAVVARELTKLHEEFARGTLNELAERFAQARAARGEMVLMISGAAETSPAKTEGSTDERLVERVNELESEGLNPKDALKRAARELGVKRAEAYRIMLAQKNRRNK